MVDQKEEAKKETFIETMPTMIQTHLITCKDWATVKDTVKSLEHIILKCDPPTPAMSMMATGATVPGTMVKVVTDNLEGSYNETEVKDLSIVNDSFKIIAIREAHHNKTIFNAAIIINPIFMEIKQIAIEAEAVAMDLINLEDVVVEGPIIRIAMEHISISITHMTHNQNNMAHPAVYVVDLTILLSIATREIMT